MRRQAHDRWGISKIVFVYCDDFLKKVYTFPWFHEPAWRQVNRDVRPPAGVLEITSRQIVFKAHIVCSHSSLAGIILYCATRSKRVCICSVLK